MDLEAITRLMCREETTLLIEHEFPCSDIVLVKVGIMLGREYT
jgi:hypothetical protein